MRSQDLSVICQIIGYTETARVVQRHLTQGQTMAIESIRQMTVEEYFDYDEAIEYKSEYIDGVVYPMMSGTVNHAAISVNAACELRARLKGTNCKPLLGNMRIGVSSTCFLYPDFSVHCSKPELDERAINLFNPILLGEVTSPFTINYDYGDKRSYFQSVASLKVYLMIDQFQALVKVDARQEGGCWQSHEYAGLDAVVPLPALNCDLPLAEIYAGIEI